MFKLIFKESHNNEFKVLSSQEAATVTMDPVLVVIKMKMTRKVRTTSKNDVLSLWFRKSHTIMNLRFFHHRKQRQLQRIQC